MNMDLTGGAFEGKLSSRTLPVRFHVNWWEGTHRKDMSQTGFPCGLPKGHLTCLAKQPLKWVASLGRVPTETTSHGRWSFAFPRLQTPHGGQVLRGQACEGLLPTPSVDRWVPMGIPTGPKGNQQNNQNEKTHTKKQMENEKGIRKEKKKNKNQRNAKGSPKKVHELSSQSLPKDALAQQRPGHVLLFFATFTEPRATGPDLPL